MVARPRLGGTARKVVTAVVGGLLTLIGIALLVLPGPGFVMIAAGLAVLAREFPWAARPLKWAERRAREGLDLVASDWRYATLDGLAGLGLIGLAVADLVVGLPLLDLVADGCLCFGGLFLLGSILYARGWLPARLLRRRNETKSFGR